MVVSPKHPKMIIFSRKTHGCWGTTILGNIHSRHCPWIGPCFSWGWHTFECSWKNQWFPTNGRSFVSGETLIHIAIASACHDSHLIIHKSPRNIMSYNLQPHIMSYTSCIFFHKNNIPRQWTTSYTPSKPRVWHHFETFIIKMLEVLWDIIGFSGFVVLKTLGYLKVQDTKQVERNRGHSH